MMLLCKDELAPRTAFIDAGAVALLRTLEATAAAAAVASAAAVRPPSSDPAAEDEAAFRPAVALRWLQVGRSSEDFESRVALVAAARPLAMQACASALAHGADPELRAGLEEVRDFCAKVDAVSNC